MLKSLWDWLYLSRCLVEEGSLKGTGSKHPGVKSILKSDASNQSNNSTCDVIPWTDVGNANCVVKVYR